MDELTLASTLISEAETAVGTEVPVKTKGGGSHESPVILLADLDARRIKEGNTPKGGYVRDSNGDITHFRFVHHYEATPKYEARSTDEARSYNLASNIRNHLTYFEEYTDRFHADAFEFSVGEVTQTDPQVNPLPEPTYKHFCELTVKYTHVIERELTTDDPQEIDSISDSITNDESLD